MKKTYFVSYNCADKKGSFGFGNISIILDKEITEKDVRKIEEYIAKIKDFKNVVILNFIEVQNV